MITDFWVKMLIEGKKTLAEINEPRKTEVKILLEQYVLSGEITEEQYNEILATDNK
jgi:uncharacterized membrane protein